MKIRSIDAPWQEEIHHFDEGQYIVDVYFGKKKYCFNLPWGWNDSYYCFRNLPDTNEPYTGLVFIRGWNGFSTPTVQLTLKNSRPITWHIHYGGNCYVFNWYLNGTHVNDVKTTNQSSAELYKKFIDEFKEIALDYEEHF
jgi:hypothetical protein